MLIGSNIQFLVAHCSDKNDEKDLKAIDIHNMHLKFGCHGIGYSKIISKSGEIENGGPEYCDGIHVKGKNHISLGFLLNWQKEFYLLPICCLRKILRPWRILYPNAEF